MRLGPELFISILVFVRDFLQGRPTENSVVADERRDVTIGDSVANSGIDEVGEEGNAGRMSMDVTKIMLCLSLPVFEEAVGNLHNAR